VYECESDPNIRIEVKVLSERVYKSPAEGASEISEARE
jgi:hypothetical protein